VGPASSILVAKNVDAAAAHLFQARGLLLLQIRLLSAGYRFEFTQALTLIWMKPFD